MTGGLRSGRDWKDQGRPARTGEAGALERPSGSQPKVPPSATQAAPIAAAPTNLRRVISVPKLCSSRFGACTLLSEACRRTTHCRPPSSGGPQQGTRCTASLAHPSPLLSSPRPWSTSSIPSSQNTAWPRPDGPGRQRGVIFREGYPVVRPKGSVTKRLKIEAALRRSGSCRLAMDRQPCWACWAFN